MGIIAKKRQLSIDRYRLFYLKNSRYFHGDIIIHHLFLSSSEKKNNKIHVLWCRGGELNPYERKPTRS